MRGHRVVGAVNRFWGNVGRLIFHILRPDGAHWGNFWGLPFWDILGPILIQGGIKVTGDKVQLDLSGLLLRSFAIDGGIEYPQAEVVPLPLLAEDQLQTLMGNFDLDSSLLRLGMTGG